jgi:hypothetical protein
MRMFSCGCHVWSKIPLFFPQNTNVSCRTPTWCRIGNSSNSPALICVLSRGSRKRKTGSHIEILSASSSQHTHANRNALCPLHWMWRILIYLQIELPNSTEAWCRLADSNCDHCGVNYSDWTFTLPALMSIQYTVYIRTTQNRLGSSGIQHTLGLLLARDHSLPNQLSRAR